MFSPEIVRKFSYVMDQELIIFNFFNMQLLSPKQRANFSGDTALKSLLSILAVKAWRQSEGMDVLCKHFCLTPSYRHLR